MVCLVPLADGAWVAEPGLDGQPTFSAGRVTAVKSRMWEVVDKKMDLVLAADSRWRVWVELGDEELPFVGYADAVTVPVADLSGVATPPTPPPRWEGHVDG